MNKNSMLTEYVKCKTVKYLWNNESSRNVLVRDEAQKSIFISLRVQNRVFGIDVFPTKYKIFSLQDFH